MCVSYDLQPIHFIEVGKVVQMGYQLPCNSNIHQFHYFSSIGWCFDSIKIIYILRMFSKNIIMDLVVGFTLMHANHVLNNIE